MKTFTLFLDFIVFFPLLILGIAFIIRPLVNRLLVRVFKRKLAGKELWFASIAFAFTLYCILAAIYSIVSFHNYIYG